MQLTPMAYKILFGLLTFVYVLGLFVPLPDNDAAHHANIALHMYLTGDYIRLIDAGNPYLDKPHFLFWTAALSYHLFGVTAFAYRFTSFLFTVVGIWSTYKLGQTLYNRQTGKLAALMTASCFAIILANNDVRMEAILTGAGMLATWQGIEWLRKHEFQHAVLFALALAIGFSTKGWSGIVVPVSAIISYIIATKGSRELAHPQLLLMFISFTAFIMPVLYCYYLQFDRHPELVIREQTGWSGVRFILWDQNMERFQGDAFGGAGKHNTFMFFHSFLWAFAPWSFLAIVAIIKGKQRLRSGWWLTVIPMAVMAVLMTFSGYRLPHYLNVILPFSALLTAAYFTQLKAPHKAIITAQTILCILVLFAILLLNTWAFPLHAKAAMGMVLVAGCGAWLLLHYKANRWVVLSALSAVIGFYLLNTNFYPQLLTYQGGTTLARSTAYKVHPKYVYFWPGVNSPSYCFYSKTLQKDFADSLLHQTTPVWVLAEGQAYSALKQSGLPSIETLVVKNYSTTNLTPRFINPPTRSSTLDSLYLIRVK